MEKNSNTQNLSPQTWAFDAFGTVVTVKVFGPSSIARGAFDLVESECRRYEALFSAFEHTSDIGRLNAAGGAWTEVSAETYDLLERSIGYCERSRGLFDITVKPLVELWDVHRGVVPSPASVELAKTHVGIENVQMRDANGVFEARLVDERAAIDLGGTAKGYIADRLCEKLVERGCGNFILSLGGNVATRGTKPGGKRFVFGVRDPNDHGRVVGTVEAQDASIVASGLSERYFVKDGVSYGHIIDPRSGNPVETDVRSVTIVGKRSVDCDGFSTTLLSLGMDEGMSYFREVDELAAAVFVGSDGSVEFAVKGSCDFAKYLPKRTKP